MKSLIQTAAVVIALALPVASFAQSTEPATQTHSTASIQVARAGAAPQDDASAGYGGVADDASQSGSAIHSLYDIGLQSIYTRH